MAAAWGARSKPPYDALPGSRSDVHQGRCFKGRYRLPFTLLTDPGGAAAKAMGVKKTLGLFPGWVTFVIDRQGQVVHTFDSALRATKHVDEALQIVKKLSAA